jgi:hypothetical protein
VDMPMTRRETAGSFILFVLGVVTLATAVFAKLHTASKLNG